MVNADGKCRGSQGTSTVLWRYTFVLFFSCSSFLLSLKPRPFVQPCFVLRYSMHAIAPTATRSYLATVLDVSLFLIIDSLDVSLFPSVCVCVCFLPIHSGHQVRWTYQPESSQEEGHTGFFIHLLSAVRALIFLARRIQPFLSLVDREVEFCVLTI